jgi:Asp-tRNA(Asn)/Glu-tRNA(Gln) amidotransferase B subunit
MARGKPTPDAKKEQIRALLMATPDASSRDIAKIVKLPDSTVRTLMPELMTADEFDQYRHAKKTEFITAAWDTVKKIHMKINEKLENMDVEQLAKVNIRDLAVALGTIYDKQALASGEPTIISERAEPTPEIIQDMERKLEKMKQLIKKSS